MRSGAAPEHAAVVRRRLAERWCREQRQSHSRHDAPGDERVLPPRVRTRGTRPRPRRRAGRRRAGSTTARPAGRAARCDATAGGPRRVAAGAGAGTAPARRAASERRGAPAPPRTLSGSGRGQPARRGRRPGACPPRSAPGRRPPRRAARTRAHASPALTSSAWNTSSPSTGTLCQPAEGTDAKGTPPGIDQDCAMSRPSAASHPASAPTFASRAHSAVTKQPTRSVSRPGARDEEWNRSKSSLSAARPKEFSAGRAPPGPGRLRRRAWRGRSGRRGDAARAAA